jgi:glutathione synthase/RimK-type ligase-like ATP-grasp enzyme
MPDIVLVTDARGLFSHDARTEVEPLVAAFHARGVTARLGAWDDPAFDWSKTGLSVLRTPWNYHRKRDAFVAWARTVPHLMNPAEVVAWNSHKGYLRALEEKGIPIVPTEWISKESSLDEVLTRRGWREGILKPAVSAGSFRTRRFTNGEAAQELLSEILTETEAMVQPYLASVDATGERSICFFGGKLSHAVKRFPPLATGLHGGVAIELPADEKAFAERVLAAAPGPLLYARVDVARDDSGTLRLMELEVIEPSFFLDVVPEAAQRFADAVLQFASESNALMNTVTA